MKPPEEYVLQLGQDAKIKKGFFTTYSVIYAGMVSDDVFSLAVTWTAGHASAAYNVYFGKGQREADLLGGHLTVLDVNRREIRFQFRR